LRAFDSEALAKWCTVLRVWAESPKTPTDSSTGSLLSYGLQAELGYHQFTVGVRQNFNKPFNEAVLPANIQLDAQPNFYNASVYATVRFF